MSDIFSVVANLFFTIVIKEYRDWKRKTDKCNKYIKVLKNDLEELVKALNELISNDTGELLLEGVEESYYRRLKKINYTRKLEFRRHFSSEIDKFFEEIAKMVDELYELKDKTNLQKWEQDHYYEGIKDLLVNCDRLYSLLDKSKVKPSYKNFRSRRKFNL